MPRADLNKLKLIIEAAATQAALAKPDVPPSPAAALDEAEHIEQVQHPIKVTAEILAAAEARIEALEDDASYRTVRELRPRRCVSLSAGDTIAAAATALKAAGADAGVVVSAGILEGILTDTDVARKVIAQAISPLEVTVASVMTSNPLCVMHNESATQALATMIENRFRHLPVLDADGEVEGLLSIDKCLYDAMSAIDRLSSIITPITLGRLLELQGSTGEQPAAIGTPTSTPTGTPTKHSTDETALPSVVPATSLVLPAAALMAKRMKAKVNGALLVEANGKPCVGIITPKDLLYRVVAAGRSAASTTVESVMTAHPDTIPANANVLQALHQLQCGGYRTLPVVSKTGLPLGTLDVLALMEGALFPGGQPLKQLRSPAATPPASVLAEESGRDELLEIKGVCAQIFGSDTYFRVPNFGKPTLANLRHAIQSVIGALEPDIVIAYDNHRGERIALATDADVRFLISRSRRGADPRLVLHVTLKGVSKYLASMHMTSMDRSQLAVGGAVLATALLGMVLISLGRRS